MRKTYFPIGGINDIDHVTEDNVMQEIINLEQRTTGKMQRRFDPMEYDSNLTSKLTRSGQPFENGTIIYIPEEPFYPSRKPSDMYSGADIIIPVFGTTSDDVYVLYVYYQDTATSWTYTQIDLTDQGINYVEESNLIMKNIRGMILILDYEGNNEPHYVKVDDDDNIAYDLLRNSVARPDRRPYIDDPVDDDINYEDFFTSEETDSMQSPKMFQWFYTIVNIYGDEGNPSPGSLPTSLLYFKEDADYTVQQYVKNVTVKGMSLPTGASDLMKAEAKYFRLYRKEWDSDNSPTFTKAKFVADIEILDSSDESSYTDTIQIADNSAVIKFDNDTAPIARDAEILNNRIILSNLKLKTSVVGKFDYIHKIPINNLNSEVYPNGIVRMRIDYDIIDNPDAKLPNLNYCLANKYLCRLFDSDLATPIPTVYQEVDVDLTEECGDPNFETGSGWSAGTGWSINTVSEMAVADGATGDLKQTGILSNTPHIFRIVYSPSLDGLIQLEFGGTPVTITSHTYQGVYLVFTYSAAAQGAAQDFVISPIGEGTVSGKVVWASASGGGSTGNPIIDVWMRIPNIIIGKKSIFFAYCVEGSGNTGVKELDHWIYDSSDYSNGEYGEFLNIEIENQWAGQKVFQNLVYRKNSYICCPLAIPGEDNVINVANELNNGIITEATISTGSNNLHNILSVENDTVTTETPIQRLLTFNDSEIGSLAFYGSDFRSIYIPNKFTVYMRFSWTYEAVYIKQLFGIYEDSNEYIAVRIAEAAGLQIILYNPDNHETIEPGIFVSPGAGTYYYFLAISFDKYNEQITIFYQDLTDRQIFKSLTVSTTYLSETIENLQEVDEDVAVYFGAQPNQTYDTEISITGFGLEEGFFDGDDSDQNGANKTYEAALVNMASYMPASTKSIIGYDPVYVKRYDNDVSTTVTTIVINGADVTDDFEDIDDIYFDNGTITYFRAVSSVVYTGGNTVITVTGDAMSVIAAGTNTLLIGKIHNRNITFDTDNIEKINYEEKKNIYMYTNPNGMSFPVANIGYCGQEIKRLAKLPTTLAEMQNSVIMFHRNGFTRFLSDQNLGETSPENMIIPQLRRAGIIADRSLKVTPHGVVWFSEAGIQLLNGIEPELISQGVEIPIKSTYISYYCRNNLIDQYGLHDPEYISELVTLTFNETSITITSEHTWSSLGIVEDDVITLTGSSNNKGQHLINSISGKIATVSQAVTAESDTKYYVKVSKTWVYDFINNNIITFRSLDFKAAMELSGGNLANNIMLLLSENYDIDKYPDFDNASNTTALAKIKKIIREHYAEFFSLILKYSNTSGNAEFKTTIHNALTDTDTENSYAEILNYRPYVLSIDHIGDRLDIEIKNTDIIEYIILESKKLNNPY